MSVAATCALLGWTPWILGETVNADGDVFVEELDGGAIAVVVGLNTYNVSCAAFDLAALLELRGVQALDVGPCEECEGEPEQIQVSGPDEVPDGWVMHEEPAGEHDGRPWYYATNCAACAVDGKPTGRRIVPAFEAALMGEPRTDRTGYSADTRARAMERASDAGAARLDDGWSSWRIVDVSDCPSGWIATVEWTADGHEGARAALRQLAEGWREHLPVLVDWLDCRGYFDTSEREEAIKKWAASRDGPLELADWLGAYGGDGGASSPLGACPCVPRHLAECPALATWVLAWLAGPREPFSRVTYPHGACLYAGLAIGPHLPAIRAHLAEAWRRATVQCGECKDGRQVSRIDDDANARMFALEEGWLPFDSRPAPPDGEVAEYWSRDCPRCAGLGRVKPQLDAELEKTG